MNPNENGSGLILCEHLPELSSCPPQAIPLLLRMVLPAALAPYDDSFRLWRFTHREGYLAAAGETGTCSVPLSPEEESEWKQRLGLTRLEHPAGEGLVLMKRDPDPKGIPIPPGDTDRLVSLLTEEAPDTDPDRLKWALSLLRRRGLCEIYASGSAAARLVISPVGFLLEDVIVAPGQRGRGEGTRFLRSLLEPLDRPVWLFCEEKRVPFYERLGFVRQ